MVMNIEEDHSTDGAVEVLLEEIARAEESASAYASQARRLRLALTERLRKLGRKRYAFADEDTRYQTTLVHSRPIVIDFDKMIEDGVLTTEEQRLITKTEFSKTLLEAAVDSGEIKAHKIAPYISTPKESYSVRFKAEPVRSDGSGGSGDPTPGDNS